MGTLEDITDGAQCIWKIAYINERKRIKDKQHYDENNLYKDKGCAECSGYNLLCKEYENLRNYMDE